MSADTLVDIDDSEYQTFVPIDPLEFQRELWPKVRFYDKQREIIHSVEHNKITVVPASNMMGKDFVAGYLALSFFLRFPVVRVITTSVSDDHLRVLWSEINRFIVTCKYPLTKNKGGCLKTNHRDVTKWRNGEECKVSYLRGKVSEKGEGMAGHHAPMTLAVIDEACHDNKTEVLTEYGWRLFANLNGSEKLLTMNPDTREAEYQLPTRLYRSYRKGKMYQCEKRGCSFSVTPNHRMLWSKYRSNCNIKWSKYYLEAISNINNTNRKIPRVFLWRGINPETYIIPSSQTERSYYDDRIVSMKDWLEFLGWYLSEGSVTVNPRCYVTCITQKDRTVLDRLYTIAVRMGFAPKIYEGNEASVLKIHNPQLAKHLITFGKYCYEKRVPEFVYKLSPSLIQILVQAYIKGDGYRKQNSNVIYTSSKKMADGLQILIYKLGKQSTVTKRQLIGITAPNGTSRHDGYVVSMPDDTSNIKLTKDYIDLVDYDGEVFCAHVPKYHTLFTRRDGVCMWSGNSGVDDIVFTQMETWAKRILIIGNPLPCTNFFSRFVEEGDIEAPI